MTTRIVRGRAADDFGGESSTSSTTATTLTTTESTTAQSTSTTEAVITVGYVCGDDGTGSTDIATTDIEEIDDIVNTLDLCENP